MTEKQHPTDQIAIIGLGIIGSALARNLITHGFSVTGFDPDNNSATRAAEMGVAVTADAAEAMRNSDIILTSLPSEAALVATIELLTTDSGQSNKDQVLVELSTLSLDCKTEAHGQLGTAGIAMLDCPISGTGAQAQTADIALYASGDEPAFKRCREIFDAVARDSFFLGAIGNGTRMKFVANLLVAIHNVASAEALNLAARAGLDPQQVYDVISSGAGTSKIFELRGPMMVADNYDPATM
ncbi:MAG: NAD(P)-dependent oxidoreductase [Rhodospirillaceae bacterium]|nr:NAD(P)-dependent oxidoreductase [Rhodospirillaceae bacterium]